MQTDAGIPGGMLRDVSEYTLAVQPLTLPQQIAGEKSRCKCMTTTFRDFHPAVQQWFAARFVRPTAVQRNAWPVIMGGRSALISAPTGAGKTFAAFLVAIDRLLKEQLYEGLGDRTRVLYVSPLKALSNDIRINLQDPLAEIQRTAGADSATPAPLRVGVRTGDTPAAERRRMRRKPPHILVTTPESLFILLTSGSGREALASVQTVIIDEIHALAGNKRGAHLSLSLARLDRLCACPPQRIGLSATQKPLAEIARFLVGAGAPAPAIVDQGFDRERDLAIEVPQSPLSAVMSHEVWQEVYDRIAALARQHRSTLVFVNTRRLAERAARFLAERLGDDAVAAHHGSLAREQRLEAEQRLKAGHLAVLVATASLELGIDIGDVDLVCQVGSPRSIAVFLQRVGRSGHAVGKVPKGRLWPLTVDELLEATALLDAVRRGELETMAIVRQPLDVLAQQIVAEVGCGEWAGDELFECLTRAYPYRCLDRERFDQVLAMLAEGYPTQHGRRGAYLHWDRVNDRLRPRRGAKLTAVLNGGVIPDQFDYDVFLQPENLFIGTLNEDFAFESLPGDIFQLGNTSYRILRVEPGKVFVEDARGLPPNIPFWFGEAPGRSDELSRAVSRLRQRLDERLATAPGGVTQWLQQTFGLTEAAARQLNDYFDVARRALGVVPSQQTIVVERFFDQTGDSHIVVHSPYGSRLNRAWGLALRKRFCRKFNFELQAAALEDSIVLSLGPTHSFPLAEIKGYLHARTVRQVLTQAVLTAPLFPLRWRWVAAVALAVRRMHSGGRRPAQFQRNDAEDLLAVVFPDQLACQENIVGEREIPDHPLVTQCLDDCLTETMDIAGLERLLDRLQRGEIRFLARDLTEPSPLAQEILSARPYAFLDDAPAEERRTAVVRSRRWFDPHSAEDFGVIKTQAIDRVRREIWPQIDSAETLHDALLVAGFLTVAELAAVPRGQTWLQWLQRQRRVCAWPYGAAPRVWLAAERLHEFAAVFGMESLDPALPLLEPVPDRLEGMMKLLQSRLSVLGPTGGDELAVSLGFDDARAVIPALAGLEQAGQIFQGVFLPGCEQRQWCDRGVLARIHRYSVQEARREIAPVSLADFYRFLCLWQYTGPERVEGGAALDRVLARLEGVAVPVSVWEQDLLPQRCRRYLPPFLDRLCATGRFVWVRPVPDRVGGQLETAGGQRLLPAPVSTTPVLLVPRENRCFWVPEATGAQVWMARLPVNPRRVLECLWSCGALFYDEIVRHTRLLPAQVEEGLAGLVSLGLVSCDSFGGLRRLTAPRRPRARRRRGMGVDHDGFQEAGRWETTLGRHGEPAVSALQRAEYFADILLARYGVVFRKLAEQQPGVPPWRELLGVLRRREARGEIRGGRFVEGVAGEQYAGSDALAMLRRVAKHPPDPGVLNVSAYDPLNLSGVLWPGKRVPAAKHNRLLLHNGVPVAARIGGTTVCFQEPPQLAMWEVERQLALTRVPTPTFSSHFTTLSPDPSPFEGRGEGGISPSGERGE